ncbi:MAG: hypothetical protein R3E04_04340 [Sphingobium sp.]
MSTKFENEKPSQPLSGVMEMIDSSQLSLDDVRLLVNSALEMQEPLRSASVLEPLTVAKLALRIRRRRDAIFSDELGASSIFGEAAWDMLLDLFVSRSENKRVSVSSLCIASGVPATTALRGRVRQDGVNSALATGHRQAAFAVMCKGWISSSIMV